MKTQQLVVEVLSFSIFVIIPDAKIVFSDFTRVFAVDGLVYDLRFACSAVESTFLHIPFPLS
jgi:hypothetical protein